MNIPPKVTSDCEPTEMERFELPQARQPKTLPRKKSRGLVWETRPVDEEEEDDGDDDDGRGLVRE